MHVRRRMHGARMHGARFPHAVNELVCGIDPSMIPGAWQSTAGAGGRDSPHRASPLTSGSPTAPLRMHTHVNNKQATIHQHGRTSAWRGCRMRVSNAAACAAYRPWAAHGPKLELLLMCQGGGSGSPGRTCAGMVGRGAPRAERLSRLQLPLLHHFCLALKGLLLCEAHGNGHLSPCCSHGLDALDRPRAHAA